MQEKSSNSSSPIFFTPLLVLTTVKSDNSQIILELLATRFQWSSPLEHPDITWVNPPDAPLAIEHVRQLPEITSTQPRGEQRFLLLPHFDQASLPAQNALLKILEEPPARNQFVLLASNIGKILPTIQSRVLLIANPSTSPLPLATADENQALTTLYTKLVSSSYADKIDIAEEYTDRDKAQTLTHRLIKHLHTQLAQVTHTPHSTTGNQLISHLNSLLKAQELLDKNVNVRLVLEDAFFSMKQKA